MMTFWNLHLTYPNHYGGLNIIQTAIVMCEFDEQIPRAISRYETCHVFYFRHVYHKRKA